MTKPHLTKLARSILEQNPKMDETDLMRLRLMSTMKAAIECELEEGALPDKNGVRNVMVDCEAIIDAHMAAIAYYVGMGSFADKPENILKFSAGFAGRLAIEIANARCAFKDHLARGGTAGENVEIIDMGDMAQAGHA